MARFVHGPLGQVKGKIGNYVVRKMNGKYFISLRPDSYNASQSKKSKITRNRFGICVRFAKIISGQHELSAAWKSAGISGSSAYHRIIKHNIKRTIDGELSASNIITPEGLSNPFLSIQFNKEFLSASLINNPARIEFPSTIFTACFIIYMITSAGTISKSDSFRLISKNVDAKQTQEIKLNFSADDIKIFNEYKDFIIYSAAVWFDETDKINWSSTSAKVFNFTE